MADRCVGMPTAGKGLTEVTIGMGWPSYQTSPSNGTVQRSSRSENLKDTSNQDSNLSLMEKLRLHSQNPYKSDFKSKYIFRALFQFQAITQLYMTLQYLIPYVFSDYDPMTQYYLKVLVCYIFVMGEANWLCAICYSCRLPDHRDRPSIDYDDWYRNPPETFGQNGHIKTAMNTTSKNGLQWRYCSHCQRYKPPRAHHCHMCKTCILRRDHHCYLIGTCIGHYNQRYFIVFCFLGVITAALGLYFTFSYLVSLPGMSTWLDYIFPWSLLKFVAGDVSWQFCLLTFHMEMLAVFGSMSLLYGIGQFSLVCVGMTLYEVAKKVDVKVSSSVGENLRLVFGDYWGLNFLFPAQILFKQRHDGMEYDSITYGNTKISVE